MTEEGFAGFVGGRISERRSSDHVRPMAIVRSQGAAGPKSSLDTVDETDDDLLDLVRRVIDDGFGGVILSGPPGTGKSWSAAAVARKLVGHDDNRVRFVQFHPAYQYEDFIEGYVPDPTSGSFVSKPRHLLVIAESAADALKSGLDGWWVLVIDELSRVDPARVFGEALTYIEGSKRGIEFSIASGRTVSMPPNLFVVATMNEFDRGVDDVDAAFDRRFARIQMDPDADIARAFLADAGMAPPLADRVTAFYRALLRNPERSARIGHTYFQGLKDEVDLQRRWRVQLSFVLRKAFGNNVDGFRDVEESWNRIFRVSADDSPREADGDTGAQPARWS